jgi:NCS1 family nucleobase:cation symporter-1
LTEPLISSHVTRVIIAILALLGVMIATISVNIAANVVSPANDFSNLSPRHISFKTGGLITGIIGIIIMPWKLLASADVYIFNWLVGYSGLLGPIAGIMIVDYWILRKQNLVILDLYREEGSTYKSFYIGPIIALIIGVLPNVPGFIRSAFGLIVEQNFFDKIYPYAWFTGFIISALIHWLIAILSTKENYEYSFCRGVFEDGQKNYV